MTSNEFVKKWLDKHQRPDVVNVPQEDMEHFVAVLSDVCEAYKGDVLDNVCNYIKNHIDPQLIIYHENTWCNLDGFIAGMRKELGL